MGFNAERIWLVSNGNLNLVPSSAPGVFGYITRDTAAQVGEANYFAPFANNSDPSGTGFTVGDLILANCSDGTAQFIVTRAGPSDWLTERAELIGADASLSNLTSTAVNVNLNPETDNDLDLGTQILRWRNAYLASLRTGSSAGNTLELSARDTDGGIWTPFVTLTAGSTPTCELADGVTAVTQTANDNSTKIATTEYVDNAVGFSGANVQLSNLSSVAINTDLTVDSDAAYDLGATNSSFANAYTETVRTKTGISDTLKLQAYNVGTASYVDFMTLTAGNVPSCVLGNGTVATTQPADTNDLTIATTAYVDRKLSKAANLSDVTNAATSRTNLDAQQTLSGLSLTAVTVAGTDKVLIQDTSDSNNLKTVTAQSIADLAVGGGAAPSDATYVTLSTNGTLSNERVLTGTSNQVVITDGGAGSTVTLSLPQSIATTSTPTFGSATLTNSLTVGGNSTAAGFINILEDSDNGSNKVVLAAPSTLAADTRFQLPADNGTSTYVLSTDGSGNTSWVAQTGGGTSAAAWVNFNGTGTIAIRSSVGVSSLTDNGTGDYTVNLTSTQPNANYCALATAYATNNNTMTTVQTITTTAVGIKTVGGPGAGTGISFNLTDSTIVGLAIFVTT